MRKFTLLVFIIFGQALTAQNDDVKHTIETFFEGFHHRDTVLLHQVCADKMILQSIIENSNGNSLTEEPSQFFYRSAPPILQSFSKAIPAVPYKKNRILPTLVKADKSFRWSLSQPNQSNGKTRFCFLVPSGLGVSGIK